jgi:S-adenosylmethionine synthetase
MKQYFSSESVTEGHPDKVCDNVSDAILDACLAQDPASRVAVETLVTKDFCCMAGEITTKARVNFDEIARKKIAEIGYTDPSLGFSDKSKILVLIHEQSPDISQGVTEGEGEFKEQGAGDQGMMFGYASNDTPELMPLPISLAHDLARRLTDTRKDGEIKELLPDGKTQVTIEYENGKPKRVDTVVVASHHKECDMNLLRKNILEKVIKPVLGNYLDSKTRVFINATGRFVLGGPAADTGVTGRKIIVDTYGGKGHHGGGAFSGKDPTKVDRSAAYAARYIAKNIVAAGLAEKCEVQLAYCIGYADPLNIHVECFGTNKIPQERIEELIRANFPLKPASILKELDLRKPIYGKTSAYGHFGKAGLPWEKTDKAEILKKALN